VLPHHDQHSSESEYHQQDSATKDAPPLPSGYFSLLMIKSFSTATAVLNRNLAGVDYLAVLRVPTGTKADRQTQAPEPKGAS
jgi:hypothetical protein